MLEIHFEINGRRVDPRNAGDALKAAVLKSVQDLIAAKVSAVRCPVHGEGPKIVAHGSSLDKLSMTVSGCCQELIDQATARLK